MIGGIWTVWSQFWVGYSECRGTRGNGRAVSQRHFVVLWYVNSGKRDTSLSRKPSASPKFGQTRESPTLARGSGMGRK